MSGGTPGSFELRPMPPRRVRNGVKLRGDDDLTARTWVAQRWMAVLEKVVGSQQRLSGLKYAQSGQTITCELSAGGVFGSVQGRAPQPYKTRWRIPALAADQWQRIFDAMAAEAVYSARLLAREVPEELESLMESLQLRLVPLAGDIVLECSCRSTVPCKHAATLGYLVAQRLSTDPLAAFELRGMPADRVLESLAAARARRTTGAATAHAEAVPPQPNEPLKPLAECLDSFWRPGPQLAELQRMPPAHHAPHALLRRMGPSPLHGGFPLVGLLASVYDTVAERAVRLRDHAERLDERNDSP